MKKFYSFTYVAEDDEGYEFVVNEMTVHAAAKIARHLFGKVSFNGEINSEEINAKNLCVF